MTQVIRPKAPPIYKKQNVKFSTNEILNDKVKKKLIIKKIQNKMIVIKIMRIKMEIKNNFNFSWKSKIKKKIN